MDSRFLVLVAGLAALFVAAKLGGMQVHELAQWALVFVLTLLGGVVIIEIVTGRIDLKFLISEENGQASMSRFQLLVFTFVIAIGLLILTISKSTFPTLDQGVLGLLGISAGSYLGAKITQRVTTAPTKEEVALIREHVELANTAAAAIPLGAVTAADVEAVKSQIGQVRKHLDELERKYVPKDAG